jgi:iron complex outermembrane recepter protein
MASYLAYRRPGTFTLAATLYLAALPVSQAAAAPADHASSYDSIQVTASRDEMPVMDTPVSISIVTGDQLRARAVTDLRTALAGLAGVEASPGGDAGPAGAVPAMWGLREFDAFLLVVDGVPWGGAFNPELTALDLHNVDRIEVMRGAAPVMYGATSFVGVIHVIHLPAGQSTNRLTVSGGGVSGQLGNASIALAQALPELGGWSQSVSADAERNRYTDANAGQERAHVLYRVGKIIAGGHTTIDVDINLLRQRPMSPYPRVDNGLDPAIDTDANFHPGDARIDQNRFHVRAGHARPTPIGDWTSTLAVSHTSADLVRGYLADVCGELPAGLTNACGHVLDRGVSDLYLDTHISTRLHDNLRAVWGLDNLYGKGAQNSRIFGYAVDPVHGNDAPDSYASATLERNELDVERNFFGVYGQLDWKAREALNIVAGLRVNNTHETREVAELFPAMPMRSRESRGDTKMSGSFGIAWQVRAAGDSAMTVYADYRDTYKPAAVDFGPGAESDILQPETANSTELGIKSHWLGGRLALDVAGFDMTMNNLVVPQIVNGSPGLTNAGTLYLRGIETELSWQPHEATTVYLAYAHHQLRFGDYERLFDATPTQLRGNAPELSPDDTASIGLQYVPSSGPLFSAFYSYTGERFLNQRNTSLAPAFGVLDVSVGYRFGDWELRLTGNNLTSVRDPVSESELGDGQYYRMPARTLGLIVSTHL